MADYDWTNEKSSVSALHEYCAKTQTPAPEYDFVGGELGNFICRITFAGKTADACGRSKRDAKHRAASIIIQMIRNPMSNAAVPDTDYEADAANVDMVVKLRDYCVNYNHPLPTIEIIQQSGTPDAPEFTAMCAIASLRRLGVAEKKKEARQLAAYEMYRLISDRKSRNDDLEIQKLGADPIEDIENERYRKFKTYRELTDAKCGESPGVLMCDRHNYFKKFYKELINDALKVLAASYMSDEEQVKDLFKVLKITPKIIRMDFTNTINPPLLIQLNCMYDVTFAGKDDHIYNNILGYFKDMLT